MKLWPIIALACMALPALADTPERAAMLVQAMRDNGCAMNGNEADATLPALGLTPDEVQVSISVLYPAGLVVPSEDDGNALSLAPQLCDADEEQSQALIAEAFDVAPTIEPWAPDVTPAQGGALIGALRDNDCALTETQAGQALPELGLGMAASRDAVAVLTEAGIVGLNDDRSLLRLDDAICAADAEDDESVMARALAGLDLFLPRPASAAPLPLIQGLGRDGVSALIALNAELNGCAVTLAGAETEAMLADFVIDQAAMFHDFGPEWPEPARAETARLVAGVLDDPGPDFDRSGDTLTLTHCTP